MNEQGAGVIAPTAEHLVAVGASGPVPQNDHVAGVSLAARLYASKHTHRLVPARLAIALAGSLGPFARQRRNSAERRAAESFMADLLLHTPRATEAQELAQRWLVEKSVLHELIWRPWLLKRSRILGREHWDVAHLGGRACLIVTGHFAATWATSRILTDHGLDHYAVAAQHPWQPMPPGLDGLTKLYMRHEYIEKALGFSRVILSDGPQERLIELLETGETVWIAFDVRGSAATPFLGRSVALAGGVATSAFKTKAMVLPLVPERHGTRIDVRLLPPIDPLGHQDPRSLRAAIAQTFEQVVLAQPETVQLAWYPSPLVTEAPPGRYW